MKTSSLILAVFVAALVAGAGGVAAWKSGMFGGAHEAPALVGGPFQMTDQNGRRVDERLLKGKWTAVFFGYTFCPEACPTTLTALARAQDQLGPKAQKLQVVFVSVDPDRDTPAQLKTYLSSQSFPKGTIGLTGSAADVARAAKAYKVFYQKSGTGPDYAMDHSTALYLMDPNGRFDRVIAYGLPPEEIARQISDAMRND
ncbi:SCO family protein [Caulobacter sp. KR2-114]|uniref:SCO family protein n=1 Tax=Caulobacter sp. KR2-114 TaxID=3400912 RepID=UPI003C0F326A